MSKKRRDRKKKRKPRAKAPAKKHDGMPEKLPPMPDRQAVEGMLFGMVGGGEVGPVDQAQDVMYEAWDTADPVQRVRLALRALEISPDCADAYVLLAEQASESLEEATEMYRKGVEAGERALGEEAFNPHCPYDRGGSG